MRYRVLPKMLWRLVGRGSEHETDYEQMGHVPGGLELEYLKVLEPELRSWGVPETCASLEVRQVAQTPLGRGVYAGVIRLYAWDRTPALRLLVGLPLLERRVRKALQPLWILEASHFAGLWLHASEHLHRTQAVSDLRELMRELRVTDASHAGARHKDAVSGHLTDTPSATGGDDVRSGLSATAPPGSGPGTTSRTS